MEMRIEAYRREHVSAVKAFNVRLQTRAGSPFQLGEDPQEFSERREYVALDPRGEVRGSFSLKRQQFFVNGQTMEVGNCQLPLSEGTFDPAYANLGLALLRHALALQPRLFCLGMGGRDKRLPRMLSAMRWQLVDIPFLFHVCHASRFMRNITPLRGTPLRRRLMNAMASSGAGWLGIRTLQARLPVVEPATVEEVSEFGPWADDLWMQWTPHCVLSAVRTSDVLNAVYSGSTFLGFRMSLRGAVVGWAVLRDTQMHDHRYFGDLRVGTIVDCVAVPAAIPAVAKAATRLLQQRGVDLIVSNQGHQSWVRGLRQCGFLSAPSNYVLAISPALGSLLGRARSDHGRMHITRGDGDGPLDL